jgi:hypothetical protein
MDKRVKALWIDALRSGEYKQGAAYLRKKDDTYCCLGVLCDLAVKDGVAVEWSGEWTGVAYVARDNASGRRPTTALPPVVSEWAGLTKWGDDALEPREALDLTGLNDNGMPFGEIADVIERNL